MNPISTFEPTIGAHVHGGGRSAAAGSAHQFVAAAGASLPFMWSAAAVALATLAGLVLTSFARLPNVSMVFLLAVLFAAARFDSGPRFSSRDSRSSAIISSSSSRCTHCP